MGQIEVILKQRFDEIPKLITVLEQFVGYEKSMIAKLVDARAKYMQATKPADKVNLSKEVNSALMQCLAVGEGYPELKSNQNFLQLQRRVSELEDSLSDRRELYNQAVTNFNTVIMVEACGNTRTPFRFW